MFNKILVALDGSESSKQIFNAALALAKATNATLMLLHVLSTEADGYPNLELQPTLSYYPGRQEEITRYLKRLKAFENKGIELLRSRILEATAAGVKAEFTQNTGNPSWSICDLARTWGADLIVMGRRGRAGLKEAVLGSVSTYVTHNAQCSVMIVQLENWAIPS